MDPYSQANFGNKNDDDDYETPYALANKRYDATSMSSLARGARETVRRRNKRQKRGLSYIGEWDEKDLKVQASDRQWEVPASNIRMLKQIGSGNFGAVHLAMASDILPDQKFTQVAVKTLTSDDADAEKTFVQEADIMRSLDGPYKIVRLLGVCTKSKPLMMILEFMPKGDLKQLLRHSRPRPGIPSPLTQIRLVQMSADIAEGMAYLSSQGIVHRDLAARNCLVDDDYTVKIGDFGLGRDINVREYYRMQGSAPLPIRWMSKESLEDGVFDSQSDVWSFGIVMWEISTLGKLPYPNLENQEVVEFVLEENIMPEPPACVPGLYDIMKRTWASEPEDRPDFSELHKELLKLSWSTPETTVEYEQDDDEKFGEKYRKELVESGLKTKTMDPYTLANFQDDSADEDDWKPYGDAHEDDDKHVRHDDKKQIAAPSTPSKPPKTDSSPQNSPDRGEDMQVMVKTVCDWINSTVNEGIVVKPDTLHQDLKTGEVLIKLMNVLKPKKLMGYKFGSKLAFQHMANIDIFLKACFDLGLPGYKLFETMDLFDDRNMHQVVLSLNALRKKMSS